jgi:outer membrane protein assembly factor BamB
MYQKFPNHNALVKFSGTLRPWKFDARARINGGLSLSGNSLFLDTFDKQLIALDVRNGHVLWKQNTDNTLMSTPVISSGLVYVGSGDNSRLSGPTGSSTYAPPRGGLGSPIWGRPEGDAVLAFTAENGSQRWRFQTVGEDMPSPAFANNKLIFINGDLHAYELDASSGRLLWMHSVHGLATMASATLAKGLVYDSFCYDVPFTCATIAIDPKAQKIVWQSPYGNSDSSPTYGDRLVFVSGIIESRIRAVHSGYALVAALNWRTGVSEWIFRTPTIGSYTEVGSSERAITGTFYRNIYYQAIPTHDLLVAFDARTGLVRWRFHSTAPIKMSPVVSGDKLFVGDTAGVLYVIDIRNGKLRASALFKQPFTTSPPVIVGRNLIIANDTTVYCLRVF